MPLGLHQQAADELRGNLSGAAGEGVGVVVGEEVALGGRLGEEVLRVADRAGNVG